MKFFNSLTLAAVISAAICGNAVQAAVTPKGTDLDPRIQYILYNADDVVLVKTRPGNTTLIQLEDDEYVQDAPGAALSIGDKRAWKIGITGNNIFLKPAAKFPETNINLVTNKRTYAFHLIEVNDEKSVSWQIRFKYPASPVAVAGSETKRSVDNGPCSDGPKNFNWFKYGDQSLSPTDVWDDGRFTCFRFPTSKALPAIYRYSPDTELKESIVNFNIKEDVLVVHEVSREFRLRIGNKVLGIKTDTLRDAPYNRKKTSTGETRVKLDEL